MTIANAVARLSRRAQETVKRALLYNRATAPTLLLILLAIPLSAHAQTTTVKTPAKVTVTLVRWPYT